MLWQNINGFKSSLVSGLDSVRVSVGGISNLELSTEESTLDMETILQTGNIPGRLDLSSSSKTNLLEDQVDRPDDVWLIGQQPATKME